MNEQPLPRYNYPVGTILEIDDRPYKPQPGLVLGRVHLMDCHTGQPFLVPDGQIGTAMPSDADLDRLIRERRVKVVFPENVTASCMLASKAEFDRDELLAIDPGLPKVEAKIKVLDENGVKNGVKAIAAGFDKHWTQELRDEHGDPDNPHTVKRWRSERGKGGEVVGCRVGHPSPHPDEELHEGVVVPVGEKLLGGQRRTPAGVVRDLQREVDAVGAFVRRRYR